MIRHTVTATAITLGLVGCNGGGGGPGSNPLIRADVPFYAPVNVNAFRANVKDTYHVAEIGLFAQDLNRDGRDEVMTSAVSFDGSATQASWNHSTLQIFGWNSGSFTNETATWFQGISNTYVGGFTIRFGDYNGDGHIDAFAAAFTDNGAVTGSSVVLFNTGQNRFTRTDLDLGNVGAHDSVVADFNGDGLADIWLTDIHEMRPTLVLGAANGQFTAYRSRVFAGPSGVSVADYLGNGTKTLIMTDATTTGQSDTKLYAWQIQNGQLEITELAVLPADRFYLPKWDTVRAQAGIAPHAVRTLAVDFNGDGRTDTVVFSTMPKNGNVHGYAEVQFLRNDGGGSFTDVTDTILVGFDNNKTVTYNPKLMDVNNDGLMDIFMSITDYTGQSSTSVLLATQEGKFVESFSDVFQAFGDQIKSMTTGWPGSVGEIAIITGPNDKKYLFAGVETEINGRSYIKTWLSLIGSTGTVTPQATVSALQQTWPWMSPAEVNASLELSVSEWIDGVPVLDPWAAFSPIGGLGINFGGRGSPRQPISGTLAVPGMDRSALSDVMATDQLGRTFRVDLGGMAQDVNLAGSIRFADAAVPEHTWSSRFVTNRSRIDKGFDAQGDLDRWTTGARFGLGAPDAGRSMSVSMTRMPGSPWMAITGVWGTIRSSTTIDTQVSQRWSDGFWSQAGVMQTTTDLDAGLVQSVDPIWAGYAVSGWSDQKWTVFGGIQPTVFQGGINLRMPSRVDNQGVLHYNEHKMQIRNPLLTFAGVQHRWTTKYTMTKLSTQFNQQGQYRVGLDLDVKW